MRFSCTAFLDQKCVTKYVNLCERTLPLGGLGAVLLGLEQVLQTLLDVLIDLPLPAGDDADEDSGFLFEVSAERLEALVVLVFDLLPA